jgi:hypothetical protein
MNAVTRSVPAEIHADAALREQLFSFFLEMQTGPELADWLKGLGQDSRGSVSERQDRVRAHSKYPTMPPAEFPDQTEAYLQSYTAGHLVNLCDELGLSNEGNKDALYRRIMREVHYREGWLPRVAPGSIIPTAAVVMQFLAWFPITMNGKRESDYYPVIYDELNEVFGAVVYEQQAIVHGTTLKIDFHVGNPQGPGVGIEVKKPTSNSEIQKALGQVDQYQRCYGDELILFVLMDFLKPAEIHFFREELVRKRIRAVFR